MASEKDIEFAQALYDFIGGWLKANARTTVGTQNADEYEEELSALTLKELRNRALDAGFHNDDVKAAKKADLVTNLVRDKFGTAEEDSEDSDEVDEDEEDVETDEEESDEDVEEEEEEEGDEDEEEVTLTREELEAMGLRALKAAAREAGHKPADYAGMDKDAIIDLILPPAEDEDEEDEEEVEEGDEEEEGEWTKEELEELSPADLKAICKENKIRFKPGTTPSKAMMIKKILAA